MLSEIVRLMEAAEDARAKYVGLADRVSRYYAPVVHTFAAMAFLGWWLGMGAPWQNALMVAIRSGEHTSELQSHHDIVCRPLL